MMIRTLIAALLISLSSGTFALTEGSKAPNFKLPNLATGKMTKLSKYKGRVVYLDFWASWCGPCRQSLPMLNDLRKELKRKGFEVVAVNLDENTEDAKAFLKQFPVSYPILLDPQGKVPEKYSLPGMPTSYLIDKQGVVQHIHVGFKTKDMPSIRKQVIGLLRKK